MRSNDYFDQVQKAAAAAGTKMHELVEAMNADDTVEDVQVHGDTVIITMKGDTDA